MDPNEQNNMSPGQYTYIKVEKQTRSTLKTVQLNSFSKLILLSVFRRNLSEVWEISGQKLCNKIIILSQKKTFLTTLNV